MKIRTRIICGYAVVLGLACLGTAIGLAVGNHYQRRAAAFQQMAIAERKILTDLQLQILYNRPAKQLSPYLGDSTAFAVESQKLLDRIAAIQALLQDHESVHEANAHMADEDDELHHLLEEYEATVAQFQNRTQTFIQEITTLSTTSTDLEIAQQRLLAFVQSPEFQAFIDFPEKIEPFMGEVDAEEQRAEAALQRAENLRMQIILGSLVTAVAIAAGIALYTSRAIARPIQAVIDVAQQATEENNFDLQVTVADDGEVGILAKAINQLIQQVNHLLGQLQQKNVDLEGAIAQLNCQQTQIVQAEKMSSLGQLVAGVAHEINNPVNFIHGNLPHVQQYAEDLLGFIHLYQQHDSSPSPEIQAEAEAIDLEFIQEDMPKMLRSIHLGTERIRQIVLSLRNFSRMDEAEFKAVDLHEGIDSTLMILQHRLKEKPERPAIQVIKDYGELPSVECYAGQLNQVFMNILANAIDALDEFNARRTYTEIRDNPSQITIRTSVLPEDWVEIAIADNGPGIPEAVQSRIFDPFFTTKPLGEGTGMGMSISYQIITEKHGGKLDCVSHPNQGAEFVIRLPRQQQYSAAA
jgi:two-component system NtrC family sensor kinase